MTKPLRIAALLIAAATSCGARAAALQPPAQAPDVRIDETRYFASRDAERADREALAAEIKTLATTAPAQPEALEAYLRRAEQALGRGHRHAAYLHLIASRDIDDHAAGDALDEIGRIDDQLVLGVRSALRGLGRQGFARAAAARPGLQRYAYLLDKAERGLPHELPPEQTRLLDELADPAFASYWAIYQKTRRAMPFAKLSTPSGERDVHADAEALATDPDRGVRQAAWERRWQGYAAQGGIYADLLLSVVRLNDRVARLEHFPDAPTATYFARFLDRAQVDDALAAVTAHTTLFKDFQRLRARHVAAVTGIADVRPWDLALPEPGYSPPSFGWPQARSVLPRALAPLGGDYVKHVEALLDPAARRVDVAPAAGRRIDDGFSVSAPGLPSGVFVTTYRGSLGDLRTIVHESGHALQGQIGDEGGVSPFDASGPNWLSEAVAILNELLLLDDLHAHSDDPRAKAYYLQALVSDICFQIFTSAEETSLEQAIYDGVVAGRVKNAADLDALTLDVVGRYESAAATTPQLAHTWMTKRLMYQDPLYLVNYLYAGLLATKMYEQVRHDPAAFGKRYAAFLRGGYGAPPDVLLRRLFGGDITVRQLVEDDMRVLQERISALSDLHDRLPKAAAGQAPAS
jgi:oligoendopeptidase F